MTTLNTADVIQAYLNAGYRWEADSPGCLPLLTNIPHTVFYVSCTYCGTILYVNGATHRAYYGHVSAYCSAQCKRDHRVQRQQAQKGAQP